MRSKTTLTSPTGNRRQFLRTSTGVLALASLFRLPASPRVLAQSPTPLDKAYLFLAKMMDLYFGGTTLRLVQSYVPTQALNLGDIGYTYDSTLVILAFLQRGSSDDLERATVLGDSLVYGQTNDPYGDGRVRDGYHTNPYVNSTGTLNIALDDGDGGSDTGNMAWSGLAFAQLYRATNNQSYLAAALDLASFIQKNAYDTRGAGGYTGGLRQNQSAITYKSTEHNIDLYGFFTLLAEATGDPTWTQAAQHALSLVEAMWNSKSGFFWIGTGNDGVTINKTPIPEDVQTWTFLSTGLSRYQGSIDWASKHLAAKNGPFSGVGFSKSDLSGVWLEGTGHMAAALLARKRAGDATKAATYLAGIELGQAQAPNTDGHGIDAASKNHLRTGDGGQYFAALHIGATSWYCIAKQAGNPFR